MADSIAATSLESAVARSAEVALDRVAAARAAIGSVIFGQEVVVEETLVTLLAGGPTGCWSAFRASRRPSSSRRLAWCSVSKRGACSSRRI